MVSPAGVAWRIVLEAYEELQCRRHVARARHSVYIAPESEKHVFRGRRALSLGQAEKSVRRSWYLHVVAA